MNAQSLEGGRRNHRPVVLVQRNGSSVSAVEQDRRFGRVVAAKIVHDAHRNGRGRQREVEKEFCERHRHDQQRVLGPPSAVESTVVFYLVHVHVVALARMMQGTLALHLLSIVGVALLLDDHEDALVAVLHHEEAHEKEEEERRERRRRWGDPWKRMGE